MENAVELALTDDEVVALAVNRRQPWPAALATIDIDDDRALLAAAFRGRRSLAVRGLADEDGPSKPLIDRIETSVLGTPTYLCLYTGSLDGDRSVDSVNLNAYPIGDEWLTESVSDIGVHQFSVRTGDEVSRLCAGLGGTVYSGGFDPDSSSRALWLVALGPEKAQSVRISQGEVALAGFDASQMGEAPSVSASVQHIVGAVQGVTGSIERV